MAEEAMHHQNGHGDREHGRHQNGHGDREHVPTLEGVNT